jgi:hypothetical protein
MIHVAIDTREQCPWHFDPADATTTRATLPTGDYALVGDTGFAIERKSIEDYAGTISTGWERFLREVERMADWPARVVIVEGHLDDLLYREEAGILIPPAHSHCRITPAFALRQTAELTLRGVAVLFAGDALSAAVLATAVLRARARQLSEISGDINQRGGHNAEID